jgi:hypothetical protein
MNCDLKGTNTQLNKITNTSNDLLKEHICIWNNLNFYFTKLNNSLKLRNELKQELQAIFNHLRNSKIISLDKIEHHKYSLKIDKIEHFLKKYKNSILAYKNKPEQIKLSNADINLNIKINAIGKKFSEDELNTWINEANLYKNLKKLQSNTRTVIEFKEDIPQIVFDTFYETYENICKFFLFGLMHAYILKAYENIIVKDVLSPNKIDKLVKTLDDIRKHYINALNNLSFMPNIDEIIKKNELISKIFNMYNAINMLISKTDDKDKVNNIIDNKINKNEKYIDVSDTTLLVKNNSTKTNKFNRNIELLGLTDLNKWITEKCNPTDLVKNLNAFFNKDHYNVLLVAYQLLSGAVRIIIVPRFDNFTDNTSKLEPEDKKYTLCLSDNKCEKKLLSEHNTKFDIIFTHNKIKITDVITEKPETFGPYNSVYTDVTNPEYNIIDTNLISEFLSNGENNNLFLFTYGYSGAGKTSSIFGRDNKTGLLSLILQNLQKNNQTIKLQDIHLLYGSLTNNKFDDYHIKINIDKEIIDIDTYINELKTFVFSLDKIDICDKKTLPCLNTNNNTKNLLFNNDIYKFIKTTINNPSSSRGFLFFNLKIGDNTLCIVDMAGSEHPYDILTNMLPTYNYPVANTTHFLNSNDSDEKDFVVEKVKKELEDILNTITRCIKYILPYLFARSIGSSPELSIKAFTFLTQFIEWICFDIKPTSKYIFTKYIIRGFLEKEEDIIKPLPKYKIKIKPDYLDKTQFDNINKLCNMVNYQLATSVINIIQITFKNLLTTRDDPLNFWDFDSTKSISTNKQIIQNAIQLLQTSIYKILSKTTINANSSTKALNKYFTVCKKQLYIKYNSKQNNSKQNNSKQKDELLFINCIKNIKNIENTDKNNLSSIQFNGQYDLFEFFALFHCIDFVNKNINYIPTKDYITESNKEIYKMIFAEEPNIDLNKLKTLSSLKYILQSDLIQSGELTINANQKQYNIFNAQYINPSSDPVSGFSIEFESNKDDFNTFFSKRTYIKINDNDLTTAYIEQIIREGFYINQINNELMQRFKDKIPEKTEVCQNDASFYIDKYKFDKLYDCGITKLGDVLKAITPNPENNINIMLCALRTESDIKFRYGAIQTLKLVNTLNTTQ